MTPGQIDCLLIGPGTPVGGFFNSGAWRHLGDMMDRPDHNMRPYRAMIWVRDSDRPGQRVRVLAEDLKEAKEKLEAKYGEGNVFDLHDEEDAALPR